jgi:hypothetical protein
MRPWQVAGVRVDVCESVFFAYPGRASLRVLAGQPVLRTVSVAVRAIRRPGASVHGHMADSVGATDVILQHLDDGLLRPRLRRNYQLTIDRIAGTLRNAQERGEMRADADPRLTATEILAFLSGLELAWLVSPDIPAAETASRWAANQVAQLRVP